VSGEVRSYPSWIAGLRYRGPGGINRASYCAHNLKVGTRLDLRPEPDNRHDDHAVAVKHEGHHLGYIPARHAWIGEALIDDDAVLECDVDKIETIGWLFRRASFVGLRVTVMNERQQARRNMPSGALEDARHKLAEKARDACLDGLKVLDYIAPPNHSFSSEMNIEASNVEARLAMSGFDHDPALVDGLIGLAQGLVVRKPTFVRAVNAIAAHPEHYNLICDVAKQLVELSGPNQLQSEALSRLLAARKKLTGKSQQQGKRPPTKDRPV
jgi:hypothetical protein